jgi:hypothetical protein
MLEIVGEKEQIYFFFLDVSSSKTRKRKENKQKDINIFTRIILSNAILIGKTTVSISSITA